MPSFANAEKIELGQLCHVITKGTTPTSIGLNFADSGIPFLRIQDVKKRTVKLDKVLFISDKTHKALKRSIIKPNDFLITIAGTIGQVAIVPKDFPECNCNQALAILRFNQEKLDPLYLLNWLGTDDAIGQISGKKVTGVISNLSLGQIKKLKIPLPPLEEQKKIAEILDAADSLKQKDQQLVEHYDSLSQSLFLDMFDDPVQNHKGWDLSNLGDNLINIVGGKSVSGTVRELKNGEKAVIKISAVTTGVFNEREYKVVNESDIPDTLVKPSKGDLLFSRANTRELVGAVCVVNDDFENLFLPDKIWRLDLNKNCISSYYLKFLLTHDGFRENLRKVATGTSGSMLNISKAKLRSLKIPLPTFELQNRFSERIKEIEKQKELAQQSLQKSEDLFNSLLQKAFKGELTVS